MSRHHAMQAAALRIGAPVGADLSTERSTAEMQPSGSSEPPPTTKRAPEWVVVRDTHEPGRDPDPDQDVLQFVAQGCMTEALHLLMKRHGDAVYRYCRQELRDTVLAEDVHQQVFISAYHNLNKFIGRSRLRTWLFMIARHRVLDAAKLRRRANAHAIDAEVTDAEQVADPQPSPAERLDHLRSAQVVVEALDHLDPTSREVIMMRFQGGLSYGEIAQVLQIRSSALQMRVSRALRVLRSVLEARCAGDESPLPLEPRLTTKGPDAARPAAVAASGPSEAPDTAHVRPARASA